MGSRHSRRDSNPEPTMEEAEGADVNQAILEECRRNNRLFVDESFPASASSIGPDWDQKFQWRRPPEIDKNAAFLVDGFSRDDVSQGALGNCWILASLAGLAERPQLIEDIVPSGQSMNPSDGYCGAFRFRFHRFGRTVEVLVDDQLPTEHGRPVFAQAVDNEFWVCLLEKALAKFYGSYQSMEGGFLYEALEDLTGGVCEYFDIQDGLDESISDLPAHLSKCLSKGCVVCSSSDTSGPTEAEMGNGLVFGHAYTVTGATVVQAKAGGANSRWRSVTLVRCRNPWATAEWTGRWSDNDDGWTSEQKRSVGLVARNDGEFWMQFEDFLENFSNLSILHLPQRQDADSRVDWRCQNFLSEWTPDGTAGGQPYYMDTHRNNPQFLVELTDSAFDSDDLATCLVSLEEPDQRQVPVEERCYVPKGIFVYKARPGKQKIGRRCQSVACSSLLQARTVVHRFRLEPGAYILVACTDEPNQVGQFILRIFTEA